MPSSTLPKSLANHKVYQEEYRRRLLRFGRPYVLASTIIEPFLQKIVDHGSFYLRMHREVLPLVLESKSIKSQVETNEGSTEGGPETRREVTAQLFGADVERMRADEFPKYGYLSCPNQRVELFTGDEMSYQYGDVLLTMKKPRLMHRTTLTVGTSLCFDVSEHLVPTRVDDIKATCLPGAAINPKAPLSPRDIQLYMYFAQAAGSGRINTDNFHRITEILGREVPTFTFFELQYHGPVTLDDIERIDTYADDDTDYTHRMSALCAAAGIPFAAHTI